MNIMYWVQFIPDLLINGKTMSRIFSLWLILLPQSNQFFLRTDSDLIKQAGVKLQKYYMDC
jgi:hypothetical protein